MSAAIVASTKRIRFTAAELDAVLEACLFRMAGTLDLYDNEEDEQHHSKRLLSASDKLSELYRRARERGERP